MDKDAIAFFMHAPDALPIYEVFEARVRGTVPDLRIRVQKTQISFDCGPRRRMFACASLLRPLRKPLMRNPYLTVSIGLAHRADSPRVASAVEAAPGRWTHHVVLGSPDEVDDELMALVREAAAFSARKR